MASNGVNPVTVLFFGPQGSGKGTQVSLLIEELKKRNAARGTIRMDMGQLLREMADAGNYSAALTNKILVAGKLMPDFMPIYLITRTLVEHFTGGEHIIADGVTRRPNQATAFDDAMQFYGRSDYHVIDLQLSEEESIKRLLLRGRNDDTEEAIRRRLGWHKTEVEPLLKIFESRGRTIHHIDGNTSREHVHKDVLMALNLA